MIQVIISVLKNEKCLKTIQKWVIGLLSIAISLLLIIHFANIKIGYDTGLYHLQKVQWLDDYGHVPGLANLDGRLGFYSIYFYVGAIIRRIMGADEPLLYINLIISLVFVGWVGIKGIFEKDFRFRLLYVFSLLGLLFYVGLLKSLYQDVGGFITIQWVFLWVLKYVDTGEEIPVYTLLFLLAVIVSIKFSYVFIFSAVPFLIPKIINVKFDKIASIYLLLIFSLAALMIYHNYILTGWLIYPFSGLDVFKVDWKVPNYLVKNMHDVVKAFAIKPGTIEEVYSINQMDFSEWLPIWIAAHIEFMWLMYLLITSIVLNVILIFYYRFKRLKLFVIQFILIICILGWFFGAPEFRFGFVWLFITYSFSIYLFCLNFSKFFKKQIYQLLIIIFLSLIIFFLYIKKTQVFSYLRHGYPELHLDLTVKIPAIPMKKVFVPNTLNHEVIYVPEFGERAYSSTMQPIASRLFVDSILPFINDIPRRRGERLEDGFYTDSTQSIKINAE